MVRICPGAASRPAHLAPASPRPAAAQLIAPGPVGVRAASPLVKLPARAPAPDPGRPSSPPPAGRAEETGRVAGGLRSSGHRAAPLRGRPPAAESAGRDHREAAYGPAIIKYLERKGISWAVWCFDPEWGPSLLRNWDYELTASGEFAKAALHGQIK